MRASELPALLFRWMPKQRWYAAKGHTPVPMGIELVRLPGDHVIVALVSDGAGGQTRVYQIPFSWEEREAAEGDIGRSGRHAIVDATTHPDLLQWLTGEEGLEGFRRLSGEQSNTSVIGESAEGPTIVKVFRVLEAGANPDVELGAALASRGCTAVPALRSFKEGRWGANDEDGVLAVAHEFIGDGEDAWRSATSAAAAGEPIDAAGLGAATAKVHRDLAAALGTTPVTDETREAIAAAWTRRAGEAVDAVPELAGRADAVAEAYARALDAPWPDLQRIHGDLHLGQVISSPSRGWVLLDFEGEPLRPLAERRTPDLALRDVAGMLRSFDYAASSAPDDAAEWARTASDAFLDGYARHAGDPRRHGDLLRALLLDKALYEARYEATNRPEWLPLPLAGIADLLGF